MRLLFIAILVSSVPLLAQKFTISGYVKDVATGENLIGSTVFHVRTLAGTTANVHGFYSITLSKDSVTIVYSYVGYQPNEIRFFLRKDTSINVNLANGNQLEEVVVSATRADEIHDVNRMSTVNIPIDQIKALPALLGENDVLKVIQLMPGVKSSEGSTGLYVRGGGPDQNLMLLDGVPVYNASHLFGFFSVFNADAINRVELIKGGFPARYGGRLSSVIDINMRDGNMKEVHGEGSVGIIAAKATVEGPIVKDNTSFLISARRTYVDLLARPVIKAASDGGNAGYYFYDLNAKVNHILNNRNRIYLSAYTGDDKAYFNYSENYQRGPTRTETTDQFGLKWGNIITAFRWNSVLTPKLFSNLTATYSRYRFNIFNEFKEKTTFQGNSEEVFYKNDYISGIRDWATKIDFDFIPNPNHYVRFGGNIIWHEFSPGVFSFRSDMEADTTVGAKKIAANELSAYLEDDIRIGNRFKINLGGHASSFFVDNTWYHSLQPRVSTRYLLDNDVSLKAAYSTMTQFIHLLTNAGLGLPTDLWVPSTARVKPQQSGQVALGAAKTYRSQYEVSLEAYYKKMCNLIEYKDGASFVNVEDDWQDNVAVNGKGRSYGAEVLLQRKTGALTGWIGYTLSWTDRQFDNLNFGKWFPYKYDRRHDVSVAMAHTWNERMDFSAVWVYGTGNSITLPSSEYSSSNQIYGRFNGWYTTEPVRYFESRNNFKMNSYHRFDVSFSFWKNKRWGERKWTFAVYNAYNRLNPFFIDLSRDKEGNKKFVQYSLFPIIPSFTYSFKF